MHDFRHFFSGRRLRPCFYGVDAPGWGFASRTYSSKKGPTLVTTIITARCYAERDIAMASCPTVCLSVTLRYRGHIGWNSWKIISRLISITISLSADPNMTNLLQREHPQILAVIGVRYCRFSTFKPPYLWNGARERPSCYWSLIGICTRAFDWYQNRLQWMTCQRDSTSVIP